jgi:hypothetical protein
MRSILNSKDNHYLMFYYFLFTCGSIFSLDFKQHKHSKILVKLYKHIQAFASPARDTIHRPKIVYNEDICIN